jgi:dTDP-4-amino-4,6-dideoxygalactose transaminase
LYTVLLDEPGAPSRDQVASRLADEGISTSVHFPPVHLHTYYRERYQFRRGQFPAAERIADTVLSLPFSAALTDEQIDHVVVAFREAFRSHR